MCKRQHEQRQKVCFVESRDSFDEGLKGWNKSKKIFSKFLNEKNAGIYDELKRHYADILHRWNLLESRTQVGKFLQHPKDSIKLMEFLMECQQCKKPITRPPYCSSCKKIVLRCSVCRILVRGTFITIIIIVLIGRFRLFLRLLLLLIFQVRRIFVLHAVTEGTPNTFLLGSARKIIVRRIAVAGVRRII